MLIAIGRFSVLDEMDGVKTSFGEVLNGSPSARTIGRWVENHAIDQAVLQSFALEGKQIYYQEDGGQDGQNIKFVTYFDRQATSDARPHGSVKMFLVDVDTCPKGSAGAALGAYFSLKKIGVKRVHGVTSDSGAGTPESLRDAMHKEGLLDRHAFADSCGLHDLMSIGKRNGVQLIHTVFDLFAQFRKWAPYTWKNVLKRMWGDVYGGTERNEDSDLQWLQKRVQEPLLTRWWTIGSVASYLSRFWDLLLRMAWAVRKDGKSGEPILVDVECILN
ncbi:MAG: hypothetical protein SGARI_002106 [Bacillariaceae sp.]